MLPEKREHQIAMETEAGREGLAVWRRVVTSMIRPAEGGQGVRADRDDTSDHACRNTPATS